MSQRKGRSRLKKRVRMAYLKNDILFQLLFNPGGVYKKQGAIRQGIVRFWYLRLRP